MTRATVSANRIDHREQGRSRGRPPRNAASWPVLARRQNGGTALHGRRARSSKSIPCLARFAPRFASSHSNSIAYPHSRATASSRASVPLSACPFTASGRQCRWNARSTSASAGSSAPGRRHPVADMRQCRPHVAQPRRIAHRIAGAEIGHPLRPQPDAVRGEPLPVEPLARVLLAVGGDVAVRRRHCAAGSGGARGCAGRDRTSPPVAAPGSRDSRTHGRD